MQVGRPTSPRAASFFRGLCKHQREVSISTIAGCYSIRIPDDKSSHRIPFLPFFSLFASSQRAKNEFNSAAEIYTFLTQFFSPLAVGCRKLLFFLQFSSLAHVIYATKSLSTKRYFLIRQSPLLRCNIQAMRISFAVSPFFFFWRYGAVASWDR